MSMKKQKKPGKIFTVDADADTGENRSVQRRNWPVNGKTDTGCACEKPCRRHVRKTAGLRFCGGLASFAGAWGVPSQRFRISEKDILKHCWQV